ncbi:MFS transporter [Halobacterium sp. R2-5]|uniref:MFS transporter n=1 Tax=Halobacterium sp. R2-5 TaxID=2715751 RepID=UPI00142109F6|nr:MFS transporter [Halobacterium sp. R2-5]NIB99076.1 MFS transporter [Halobacterium sp. R2-5]
MTDQTRPGFDILLLTAGVWFLAKFLRYAFPPLFPQLRSLYGVSNGVLGAAFTTMMLVYALLQFPAGVVADRLGPARVVAGGVAVTGVAALVLAAPVPLAVLVGGMVLVGFGTGVHKTVAVDLLSTLYPSRRGRALGVHDTFGAFGGVVAPAVVVAVADDPGWRALFLGAGVLALVLASAFWLRTPDDAGRRDDAETPENASEEGTIALADYRALLADRRFAVFLLVTVGFSFAYNGVVAFLPLYLADAAGLDSATASLLYSVLFAVSLVQLTTGELSDRFSPLAVVVGTLALATGGLLGLLVAGRSPVVLGATVVAFGLGSHGFRPVRGVYLVDVVPDSLAGGGLGVARTILMGAGAVAPAVVGVVSEDAGFRTAFGVLFVSLALAAALAVWLLVTDGD